MNIYYNIESPIGPLLLTSDGQSLTGLYMGAPSKRPHMGGDWIEDPKGGALPAAVQQLQEYFAGMRKTFDLPLNLQGTEFQKRVWTQLTKIPFGQTWSYGQLAQTLGNPNGSRAVGLANGRNPIAVIVPCHRVIGADGSLTGFGGGIPRKQWLLAHEGFPANGSLDLTG
jgi:methylated-DNA-[protein]-cysteine S-methyltransferase